MSDHVDSWVDDAMVARAARVLLESGMGFTIEDAGRCGRLALEEGLAGQAPALLADRFGRLTHLVHEYLTRTWDPSMIANRTVPGAHGEMLEIVRDVATWQEDGRWKVDVLAPAEG